MMSPIRCWTCGTPIGQHWESFEQRSRKEDPKKVLDSLKVTRYCCRTQMLGHVELIDEIALFKKP
jgi:DNA-directed RNA polymerase subunit N